ncbi:glucans biosynthesis glucosyltransferase MdoH [Salinisphaera sp.]|uniref:glucans biosynthesis glucosyltransferase MdoH n=1 Tax=Salinisphaera sp. TaxID=1914330 RepID=UPI002D78DBDA|nr:glucans biosynthesis glucosyltransferase MdoH [Salinisphaera sp.]HET7314005.1 glucans biosynthesis glucosyltransferase MdoH [Salinisphaera sp.]
MSTTAETRRRRVVFLALVLITLVFAAAALAVLFAAGGVTPWEWAVGLGFGLTMPYTVIGFWNALIGVWLRHRRPAVLAAMPGVAPIRDHGPVPRLHCDTVLLMTLRNEAPAPAFARLASMRASLAATGRLARFTFAVASDSDDPKIIEAEARAFADFCARKAPGEPEPIYRRRTGNRGYKAGNIGEFLDAYGADFRYFLPLDSDSLMSGETIVRLVAVMEQRPEIGILQSLAVGMPSASGFARIFQFGMRHAMRSFTAGSAWWTADCGAYWGHNAVVRIAPFRAYCRLPELSGGPPLGGAVLSHDQIEAAFMRRAGFEVRVVPVETESYEINPPTLLDFIRRELRWCQGNMQYLRLLATPGLKPVSRVQLLLAIGMYIAPAAWIGMIGATCAGALAGGFRIQDWTLGMALFGGVFLLAAAPRLAGALDVWLSEQGTARYGGTGVFAVSVLVELVSSMLVAPIVALSITLFLIGLPFGKHMGWHGQNRDRLGIAWRDAAVALAPHTLTGIVIAAGLWWVGGPTAVVWAAPVIAGLALAAPYTVLSADPALGRGLARLGLFSVPEELRMPAVLFTRRENS